jgi:hypothetical protein
VDLLIAMGNAAASSSRCNLILDPYPSVVDPDNTAVLALDPKVREARIEEGGQEGGRVMCVRRGGEEG